MNCIMNERDLTNTDGWKREVIKVYTVFGFLLQQGKPQIVTETVFSRKEKNVTETGHE